VRRWLREPTSIGVAGTLVAVSAMAADHLMGDDPGLEDPPAFLLAVALCLLVAAVLFIAVLPRTPPERAARRGLVCSLLAVLSLPLAFLGFFFVLAAGGIALGRIGRGPGATAAVLIGSLVALVGIAAYTYVAITKL
jgi:drug/metabolite transporter (DMT)-like permease